MALFSCGHVSPRSTCHNDGISWKPIRIHVIRSLHFCVGRPDDMQCSKFVWYRKQNAIYRRLEHYSIVQSFTVDIWGKSKPKVSHLFRVNGTNNTIRCVESLKNRMRWAYDFHHWPTSFQAHDGKFTHLHFWSASNSNGCAGIETDKWPATGCISTPVIRWIWNRTLCVVDGVVCRVSCVVLCIKFRNCRFTGGLVELENFLHFA